jgi:serine/threonine protein kinase
VLTLTGTLLAGKYRVGNRLGGGGMGEVYEGVQEDLGRKVAIKVMSGPMANDPQLLARFQLEAKAVAALGHPHIVAVTDFQDNPNEPPFIVMERLVGESLGELLEREPMVDPTRAVRIAEQTLSALAAAHEAGLVHRDVKPDNIFLCRTDTNAEIVKLLDFGVAKAMEAQPHGKLTSTGAIVGTLVYMAPEQARGEPIDARADVYALGACL